MDKDDAFCRERVRAADRDRYLSALYAPEQKRGALFALYAFNAEIADITTRARDPMPGEVRLQWWREVLTGGDYGAETSPVARALLKTIAEHHLPRSAFETYLDARIGDLYADPFATRGDLEAYCGETAAALIQLAAVILDPQAARVAADSSGHGGCAQAIAGLIRLMPLHRARGKCSVPMDLLEAAGLTAETFLASADATRVASAVEMMKALAADHMKKFEQAVSALPAGLRPAFLPVALTPSYLAKVRPHRGREPPGDISDFRRQWTLMRRAARGW